MALEDEVALAALAARMPLRFVGNEVMLAGESVGDVIRSEEAGRAASRIAALPALRQALLERQRAFRLSPGLVADGRDMGSVVFPDAALKIFLTATAAERAQRRYLAARDARDAARSAAPLQQTADAVLLDTTGLNIEQAVQQVLTWYAEARHAESD